MQQRILETFRNDRRAQLEYATSRICAGRFLFLLVLVPLGTGRGVGKHRVKCTMQQLFRTIVNTGHEWSAIKWARALKGGDGFRSNIACF